MHVISLGAVLFVAIGCATTETTPVAQPVATRAETRVEPAPTLVADDTPAAPAPSLGTTTSVPPGAPFESATPSGPMTLDRACNEINQAMLALGNIVSTHNDDCDAQSAALEKLRVRYKPAIEWMKKRSSDPAVSAELRLRCKPKADETWKIVEPQVWSSTRCNNDPRVLKALNMLVGQ